MNEVTAEGGFDEVWKELMGYTNCQSAGWFNNMYNFRRCWATVFTRGMFTAGLLATSRCEGTNRVVKSVQTRNMTFYDFVTSYEEMKCNWRRRENKENTLAIWNPGQLVDDNHLFVQAASIYIHIVYKKFEAEATRIFSIVLSHDSSSPQLMERMSGPGLLHFNRKPFFSTCSCCKWEADGILCRHILKVYAFMNHFTIPDSQIVKRWTKTAKDGCLFEKIGTGILSTLPYMSSLQMVIMHIYEMCSRCDIEEKDQSFVLERLEKVRTDLYNVFGLPPVKEKRKVLHDLNSNAAAKLNPGEFRDPKVVKEQGFVIARDIRSLQAKKIRGTPESKNMKQVESCSLPPCMPFEMMEQAWKSPNANPPHSAGWAADNERLWPTSQP